MKKILMLLFMTIIFLPTGVKAEEYVNEFEEVAKEEKYYKVTYYEDGIQQYSIASNNRSYVTIEVSKDEYDNSVINDDVNLNSSAYVETTYRKLTTSILSNGEIYRYKVVSEWKSLPSVRSYDIIAIGHYASVKIKGDLYFYQEYDTSDGTHKVVKTHTPQYFSYGAGATFKLPTGNVSSLTQTMYYDVEKNTTSTILSQIIQDNCGLAYLKTNTQSTADEISRRLGTRGVETSSLNYSMSLLNNNGSKSTSLISRSLLTADEIKQLHYKTIIFPTIGYPIIRDTVLYNKFSCYTKGCVNRKVRPLERLVNTYYTVEHIQLEEKKNNVTPKKIDNSKEELNKKKLINIVDEVIKIFGKIDFDVEYENENKIMKAVIYLAPPLSTSDITGLETLTSILNFHYEAISNKETINRKNRNSKIEIYLN